MVVPLKSDLSADQFASSVYKSEEEVEYPSEEKLNLFRDYIISSRGLKVTLEEDLGKVKLVCVECQQVISFNSSTLKTNSFVEGKILERSFRLMI